MNFKFTLRSEYKFNDKLWWKNFKHIVLVFVFFSMLFTIFFSPVLFFHRLLAPGDGIVYYLPTFYWNFDLWNNYVFSGFPQFADPQAMLWYLPRILLKNVSWNVFVLSAYIFASSFMYGYVYKLTRSKTSSIFAGISYSMSGFFIAHLGHTDMIHAASWVPLIIWGFHELSERFKGSWFVITSMAIAFCILAGHPQIMVYSIGLSFLYVLALGWRNDGLNWKYILVSGLIYLTGFLLTAIQLIPTFELSKISLRSEMSFSAFNSFSLPTEQMIQLLFPYWFGGSTGALYHNSYFGVWNLTEITGYVGWLPLFLVGILITSKSIKNKLVIFWITIAIISLLLTLGDKTPLSILMYHIPGYNLFRVPARHFMEFSFAISVLSSLCIEKFNKILVNRRYIIKIMVCLFSVILLSVYTVIKKENNLVFQGTKANIGTFFIQLTQNSSVTIPVLVAIIDFILLIWFVSSKRKKIPAILLPLILIIDLSSFGWFYEWKTYAPVVPFQGLYSHEYGTENQRVAVLDGAFTGLSEVRPNLSQLLKINSTSGYNPLVLSRYNQITGTLPHGSFNDELLKGNNRTLDILSVKKLYVSEYNFLVKNGVKWDAKNFSLVLNESTNSNVEFAATYGDYDKIYIVSTLGNATGIPNMGKIAEIEINYSDNTIEKIPFFAGRDVSEWAFDREDVLKIVQHKKVPVFESFQSTDSNGKVFEGHRYLSELKTNASKLIKSVKITWLGPKSASLELDKISLYNSKTGDSQLISSAKSNIQSGSKWQYLKKANANTDVYENDDAMPRAWMVNQLITLPEQTILSAIKTSQLPEGKTFNPASIALVEENIDIPNNPMLEAENIKDLKIENDHIKLRAITSETRYLIQSDIYYPGWKAYIDGKEVKIYRTDFLLRGIIVPSGNHTIEFKFKPKTFTIGLSVSVVGLIFMFLIVILDRFLPDLLRYKFRTREQKVEVNNICERK